ncbi:PucR family transcriptional regulator ligand-binding domain-containing protein [Streptomyces lycii]|uniref:PucR family transcriptional regulator n=1 Tax=Streptomyces lycii TaxID=2654337 RepID=A0ABQ7FJU2_9ACTN|nr:PucR family transcriptional regulator ligand-binding domain-containing protein [Streptomyces lycii]KAF4408955.1 PucR family transcriptional regulator [Streptomyces lycii]
MRLRALLENGSLGLRLLSGEDELDRTVRGVMTTDLRDPSRYLSGGELVLSGLAWRREPADSERFVRILVRAGVTGLAAGEAELGAVPEDLVAACGRHRLPLFAVSEDVAFAAITEHVVRQVSGERAGDLAAVVERHRRLMTAGPAGGGPDAVLDLLGSDLDLRAWVLSSTGRLVAGPGAAGHDGSSGRTGTDPGGAPSPELCSALAGEHLAAERAGRRGPHRFAAAGRVHTLFPVRDTTAPGSGETDGAPGARGSLLSGWLLAVEADTADWPAERLDLLHGVTQLIAVERERRRAARAVRRRLAQEVLELVQSGAPPSEVAARLRMAAPVLLPGTGGAPHWQIVVASTEWSPDRAADRSGAPSAGRGEAGPPSAAPRADGRTAQALLEEILTDPRVTGGPVGADGAERVAVAHTGDEAVALVPLTAGPVPAPTPFAAREVPAFAADTGPVPARPGDGAEASGAGAGASGAGAGTARAGAAGTAGGSGAGDAPDSGHAAEAGERADSPAGAEPGGADHGVRAERLLDVVREPLTRGLDGGGRFTLGVSAVVHSPEALRGALEEARHARRVAAARPGRVTAAGHHELASHVLLLPFVPDDVRRAFTARLLEPLRDYDARHRAELVPTLEAFLDSDGSWTRCAARLHLHVNTLRYRMGRIEQLTGRDLARLEDKLDFFLALRMS